MLYVTLCSAPDHCWEHLKSKHDLYRNPRHRRCCSCSTINIHWPGSKNFPKLLHSFFSALYPNFKATEDGMGIISMICTIFWNVWGITWKLGKNNLQTLNLDVGYAFPTDGSSGTKGKIEFLTKDWTRIWESFFPTDLRSGTKEKWTPRNGPGYGRIFSIDLKSETRGQ